MNENALSKYTALIRGWACDRKLIPNAKADMQWFKWLSEVGELADGLAKGDKALIKDSVGDAFVVLVIYTTLRYPYVALRTPEEVEETDPMVCLLALTQAMVTLQTTTKNVQGEVDCIISALDNIATLSGFTFEECVDAAWQEIKDRKGTTTPEGVFIKEVQA